MVLPKFRCLIPMLASLLLCGLIAAVHAEQVEIKAFDVISQHSTDDLDQMKARHQVRVLTPYSETEYTIEGGKARGLQASIIAEYEKALNSDKTRGALPISVVVLPVRFNELIPGLIAGWGDIAAGLISVTPARVQQVDFVSGGKSLVDELLITSEKYRQLQSLDELSGKEVYVLAGSSYVTHLQTLSEQFRSAGLPGIQIVEAAPKLSTADIIEMVNAGIVDITVSDNYKADLWEKVLPNIVVHHDLKVHQKGEVGWAIRKNSPLLKSQLEAFVKSVKKGSLLGNMLFKRHYKSTKWVTNPTSKREREKYLTLLPLFKKYAHKAGFNYLALAAQAYQESGLDQSVVSSSGAIGIMQLLPSTAADPNVGIEHIDLIENNIHAGAKYMAFLREHYFSGDELSDQDSLAFTWAAYNAGPGRIRKIRKLTASMGLDPNKWFENAEHAAMKEVGIETVRYVSNIYKYYVAYQLITELDVDQPQAVSQGKG